MRKGSGKDARVNGISLPREYWQLIDRVAKRRGMTRSGVVALLIKRRFNALERAARGEEARL